MLKRLFDFFFSGLGLLVLSPLFLLLGLLIGISSKGGVFYRQQRVGQYGQLFNILKFRTMYTGSDSKGLLTIGNRDPRVTAVGYFLRKSKLDELPQLINVFKGDMSLVGPRPEVPKYVALYSEAQKKVLGVRPGITDYASIKFRNENELLDATAHPEEKYIQEIMPEKLRLNLAYIKSQSLWEDFKIIFLTLKKIISKKPALQEGGFPSDEGYTNTE